MLFCMKINQTLLKIGEVAQQAGTTVRTVRYYLEEDFISYSDRSDGGFYLFDPNIVEKVKFIKKLKDLGLTLKEIKALYMIRKENATGDDAYKLVVERLTKQQELTEKKIREYQDLKKEISNAISLVNECKGCQKKPNRENCSACDVVRKWDLVPSPFGAIM